MYGGKFSLTRFSLSSAGRVKRRRLTLTEGLVGSLGVGKIALRNALVSEKLTGTVDLIRTFPRHLTGTESLLVNATVHRFFVHRLQAAESMKSKILVSKELHRSAAFSDSAHTKALLSRQSKRGVSLSSALLGNLRVARSISKSTALFETAQGCFLVVSYNTACASVHVRLNPGEELRIDSDAFTVMLGQMNLLHQHEGEWIFASRALLDLIVRTGNGQPVDGKLIFTERFL